MGILNCCKTTNTEDFNKNSPFFSRDMIASESKSESNGAEIDKELEEATWENTPPFVPRISYGRIIKCYDGDSCTLVARQYPNGGIARYTLRLSGIDTPELRTSNENEKKAAIIVRDALREKILNKYVYVSDISLDKYGRLLCTVQCDGKCINSWLLHKKYAVPYDGGKKNSPEDWLDYLVTYNDSPLPRA
tara:strand:- start:2849 stop:3421 length:573 start_codon:yes stop_codon:yes gene_type:complete